MLARYTKIKHTQDKTLCRPLAALVVRSPHVAHRGTACAGLSVSSVDEQPHPHGCSLRC